MFNTQFQVIPINYPDQLVNAVKAGDYDMVKELLSLTDSFVDIKANENE